MIHNLDKRTSVFLTCWEALYHKLGKMVWTIVWTSLNSSGFDRSLSCVSAGVGCNSCCMLNRFGLGRVLAGTSSPVAGSAGSWTQGSMYECCKFSISCNTHPQIFTGRLVMDARDGAAQSETDLRLQDGGESLPLTPARISQHGALIATHPLPMGSQWPAAPSPVYLNALYILERMNTGRILHQSRFGIWFTL